MPTAQAIPTASTAMPTGGTARWTRNGWRGARSRSFRRSTSASLGRAFAEEALGPEDEDHDQDREHDRLRPVRARRVPGETLVERLDHPDQQRTEHGARQVAQAP